MVRLVVLVLAVCDQWIARFAAWCHSAPTTNSTHFVLQGNADRSWLASAQPQGALNETGGADALANVVATQELDCETNVAATQELDCEPLDPGTLLFSSARLPRLHVPIIALFGPRLNRSLLLNHNSLLYRLLQYLRHV